MYQCEKCGHFLIWEYPYGWYCPTCGLMETYTTNHTKTGEMKYDSNTHRTN